MGREGGWSTQALNPVYEARKSSWALPGVAPKSSQSTQKIAKQWAHVLPEWGSNVALGTKNPNPMLICYVLAPFAALDWSSIGILGYFQAFWTLHPGLRTQVGWFLVCKNFSPTAMSEQNSAEKYFLNFWNLFLVYYYFWEGVQLSGAERLHLSLHSEIISGWFWTVWDAEDWTWVLQARQMPSRLC